MATAVRHLPFGLARIVPPNLLGFAVINGFTFACDLALLTALHGGLRWPVAVSITLSYAVASGLSYLLNRTFNFHSHAAIGRQFATYVAVIAVNYLAWILGVGAGLAALGVSYQLARIIAGLCEAVYMYVAMRWLVFRDTRASPGPRPGPEAGPGPGLRRLPADFWHILPGGFNWWLQRFPDVGGRCGVAWASAGAEGGAGGVLGAGAVGVAAAGCGAGAGCPAGGAAVVRRSSEQNP
jgi:putative flippase GtrA